MTTRPTEEFVESRLRLAQEFLDDSKASLEQGRLRTAVDRAYYSIHNCAVALLCHHGIRPPKSHRGLVGLFGNELVNRGLMEREFGRILAKALEARVTSTYSADADVTLRDAESSVDDAERFFTATRSALEITPE